MHCLFEAALRRCPQSQKEAAVRLEWELRFFEQLYRMKRQARDKKPDAGETKADSVRRFRQQHSIPVLTALKVWLHEIAPKVMPDTKLGDPVSYTLNQWVT